MKQGRKSFLSNRPLRLLFLMVLSVVGAFIAFFIAPTVLRVVLGKIVEPEYHVTVVNEGRLAITGGRLEGDSYMRPVGTVPAGKASVFYFGNTGAHGADYRLKLVREDSSRVTVNIGWTPEDWDMSLGSHGLSIIPNDTVQSIELVRPMKLESSVMRELKRKGLIPADTR